MLSSLYVDPNMLFKYSVGFFEESLYLLLLPYTSSCMCCVFIFGFVHA